MGLETLFTSPHGNIRVNSVVMLPVGRSSGEPVFPEMHLSPDEELENLLYVGCSDCTLHVCHVVIRLDREETRYDTNTTLLRNVTISSTGTTGGDAVQDIASHGITFLHVSRRQSTPLLLVLADGTLDALHHSSLDSIGLFQFLSLPPGSITTCCVAQGQENAEQQRLAIVMKKRLILVGYTEQRAYFFGCGEKTTDPPALDDVPHMAVRDGIQTLAWKHNTIVAGSLSDYCVFDVKTYQLMQRVETTDTLTHSPLCRYVSGCEGRSHILVRMGGDQILLFDGDAETDLESAAVVTLSEPVADVAWVPPFLLGVKANGHVLLQSWLDGKEFSYNRGPPSSSDAALLGFDRMPHQLRSTPLGVYAACSNSVQLFLMMPRKTVVDLFINACQYERALLYAEYVYKDKDENLLRNMYDVCARHALAHKKYSEAFRYFDLSRIRTLELLELVPELRRPPNGARQGEYNPTRTWSSGEAYHQLCELLVRRRAAGSGDDTEDRRAVEFAIFLLYVLECVPYTVKMLGDLFLFASTLSPTECLYYVGDNGVCPKPMILPLVIAHGGHFAEALERCESQRLVHEAAIVLQMSGDEQLFAQHLPWMLLVDADAALTAVVEPQQNPLPVSLVLPMVLGYGGYTLQKYLDYLIYVENNTEPRLHTLYATNLIDILCSLQSFGVDSVKSSAAGLPAGNEFGIRGATRRTLLTFLRFSQHYGADVVLSLLLNTGLIEEQVLVFERLGDHWGALRRLVYDLNDIDGAVRYCKERHLRDLNSTSGRILHDLQPASGTTTNVATCESPNRVWEETSTCGDGILPLDGGVYMSSVCRTYNEYFDMLLHVLLVPPKGKQRLLSAALRVLNEHSSCVNPLSVMTSLPNEVHVAEISSYLIRVFQTLCTQAQTAEICANASASMLADAERYHSLLCQRCVHVNENRLCAVCGRPLGAGVMAIFPNLKTTHFRCFRAHELDPERGVPFRTEL